MYSSTSLTSAQDIPAPAGNPSRIVQVVAIQCSGLSRLRNMVRDGTGSKDTNGNENNVGVMYMGERKEGGEGKGKVHPITGHEGPDGEQMYSSIPSLASVLDGVDGQRHSPAALPPGKTRYQL